MLPCPIRKTLGCNEYISYYPVAGPIGPTGATGSSFSFNVQTISNGITGPLFTINNADTLRFISDSIGISLALGSVNAYFEFTKFNSGGTGPTSPGVTVNDV